MERFDISPPSLLEGMRSLIRLLHPGRYPLYAQLWVAHTCKLSCAGCRNYAAQLQRRELTCAELEIAILALRRLRVHVLTLTGGEPLLKNWLPNLVALARDRRGPYYRIPLVTINSNGLPLLEKSTSERYALLQRLARSGTSILCLSHDRLHWPNDDQRQQQASAILSAAACVSEYRMIPTINWTLTCADDVQEIRDLIDRTIQNGIQFNLLLYSSVGGEFSTMCDELIPTVRQVRELARRLLCLKRSVYVPPFGTVANSYSELRWMMDAFDPERPWRCAGTRQPVITVKPAESDSSRIFNLGFCQEFSLLSSDGQLDLETYDQLYSSPISRHIRQECRGCFYTCYIRADPLLKKGLDLEEFRSWLVRGAYMRSDRLGHQVQAALF